MAIYLVRHGKDEEGFRGGWSQRGLIEEGFQQSQKLGEYLYENNQKFKIKRIISSGLRRAFGTAESIANSLQLPIEQSKDWRETNNGVLAGMPEYEAREKYPGLYFNSLRMDERYPGGESPIENFTRIKNAFERICAEQIEKSHQENILIITHGGVINIIYHILKEKEWTNKNKLFPIANTSIHKIEWIENKWKITEANGMEHLK